MRKLLIFCVFSILCSIAVPTASTRRVLANDNLTVVGWGGFPLSDRLTSLWLTNGEPVNGVPQPLVLVYYLGEPGWHNRKWDVQSEFGQFSSFIKLVSEGLTLSIEYAGGDKAKVQGKAVDIASANVYLVSQVDGLPKDISVRPVGRIQTPIPDGVPAGAFVLKNNPEIAAKISP